VNIRPQKGAQEAFLSSSADIVVYGGSAGSGKTFSLALEPLRHIHNPKFAAVLFRRTSPQLTGGGSVWEETQLIYPHLDGESKEHKLEWHFQSGSTIEFRHLQYDKDKLAHQGKQYALIMFDELTHFLESQFWYMLSRNRSTSGIRPYIRATTNPDPDSFVRRLIDWWIGKDGYPIQERSGIKRYFIRNNGEIVWGASREALECIYPEQQPLSFTFIAAKLEDNPALTNKDPSYKGKLMALPLVEREQLLGGNWDVRAAAGLYFRRSYFPVVEAAPTRVKTRVRAWDLAATKPSAENPDPDASAGVLFSIDYNNEIYIEHVECFKDSPSKVEQAIVNTARLDGANTKVVLWQDPGGAGKAWVDSLVSMLSGFVVKVHKASKNKIEYANPVSSQAERGNINIVNGSWVTKFMQEAESFPDGRHDDQIDALSLAHLECFGVNTKRWENMLL